MFVNVWCWIGYEYMCMSSSWYCVVVAVKFRCVGWVRVFGMVFVWVFVVIFRLVFVFVRVIGVHWLFL